jgi:hypothetical protein
MSRLEPELEPELMSELQAIIDAHEIHDDVGMMNAIERLFIFSEKFRDDDPIILGYVTPDQFERCGDLVKRLPLSAKAVIEERLVVLQKGRLRH